MAISCFLTYWGEAQDADAVFESYRAGPAPYLAEAPGALSFELYVADGATDPFLAGDTPPLPVDPQDDDEKQPGDRASTGCSAKTTEAPLSDRMWSSSRG